MEPGRVFRTEKNYLDPATDYTTVKVQRTSASRKSVEVRADQEISCLTPAVVNSYGASIAMGLQVEYLDGNGNLRRTGILNQPTAGSTTGARTVGTVTSVGTYTVNCDGTGTITRTVTKPDGSKAEAMDDFIITDASRDGWLMVANVIVDAQRDPSVILPGGVFVTRVHTRRPELYPPASAK